jgi:hypothetical protein
MAQVLEIFETAHQLNDRELDRLLCRIFPDVCKPAATCYILDHCINNDDTDMGTNVTTARWYLRRRHGFPTVGGRVNINGQPCVVASAGFFTFFVA